jgi:hypothetical protein
MSRIRLEILCHEQPSLALSLIVLDAYLVIGWALYYAVVYLEWRPSSRMHFVLFKLPSIGKFVRLKIDGTSDCLVQAYDK